ncbi:MAG: hypothetical protein LBQ56_07090 [Synergistaceae bacterium]|jgi:YbbR domain-containing protein|nr:hypothetical protein [Synergistaceae bacterium]
MSDASGGGGRKKIFAPFDLSDGTRRRKWLIRALSLLFAMTLWLFVTWDGTTMSTSVMSVPLRYQDVSDGYSISSDVGEISVSIEGRVEMLAIMARNSVRASVSVQDMVPGKYRLPVHLSLPDGVRAVSYSPQVVECELLRIIERTLKPSLALNGDLPSGVWLDEVSVTPTEVVVKGPEMEVLAVRRAEVRLDAPELESDVTRSAPVILLGDAGEVKGLTVEPERVEVKAGVTRSMGEARVPVRVQAVGTPGGGLSIGGVAISPDVVTIRGKESDLAGITEIALDAIDVTGHTEDVVIDVPIKPPLPGIAVVDHGSVNVRVRLRSTREARTFLAVPIGIEGGGESDKWAVSPPSVSVTIERSMESSDPFDINNPPFQLYVDVTNIVSSRIVLPVLMRNLAQGMAVTRIEPPQVTAEAEERPEKQ